MRSRSQTKWHVVEAFTSFPNWYACYECQKQKINLKFYAVVIVVIILMLILTFSWAARKLLTSYKHTSTHHEVLNSAARWWNWHDTLLEAHSHERFKENARRWSEEHKTKVDCELMRLFRLTLFHIISHHHRLRRPLEMPDNARLDIARSRLMLWNGHVSCCWHGCEKHRRPRSCV